MRSKHRDRNSDTELELAGLPGLGYPAPRPPDAARMERRCRPDSLIVPFDPGTHVLGHLMIDRVDLHKALRQDFSDTGVPSVHCALLLS